MKRQTAREVRKTDKPGSAKLVKPESQLDRFRGLQKAIAGRAYELFERRGCEHGQDLSDWLRAESDVLQPLLIKVNESGDRLSVEADLLGFGAEQIEVSAEPMRLIISGSTSLTGKAAQNTFSREILAKSTEILTKRIFRLLELPVEVDADRVEARLTGDILTITVPKIVVDRSSPAQAAAL